MVNRHLCVRRYATAGTEAAILLVSVSLVPRVLTVAFDYLLPAFYRATTKAYTQVRLNTARQRRSRSASRAPEAKSYALRPVNGPHAEKLRTQA